MAACYSLQQGATVGKYEVVRKIGKGGFGDIWLCNNRGHNSKKVALKALRVNPASDERNLQALCREAEILKRLRVPTIVKFVDVLLSQDDRYLYIVMQYCEGGDLFHKLRKVKKQGLMLQEIQIVTWTLQIAMALRHIHSTGIIHRDVKTQNIFLTKGNDAKLGDFGIARLLDSSAMASTVLGTPYYLSPELHRHKPYNHKSDMWAFGCCVVEMCTLSTAFDGANLLCIGNKVLNGSFPKLPKRLSAELCQLVYALLEKEPEKRPEAAGVVNHPAIQSHLPEIIELARGGDVKTEEDSQERGSGGRGDSGEQTFYTARDFTNAPEDAPEEFQTPPQEPPQPGRKKKKNFLRQRSDEPEVATNRKPGGKDNTVQLDSDAASEGFFTGLQDKIVKLHEEHRTGKLKAAFDSARSHGARRRPSREVEEDHAEPSVDQEALATLTQSLVNARALGGEQDEEDSREDVEMPDQATYLCAVIAESRDGVASTVHPSLLATTEVRGPDPASRVMMESIRLELEESCSEKVGQEGKAKVDLALDLLSDVKENLELLRDILGDKLYELLPSLQRLSLLRQTPN